MTPPDLLGTRPVSMRPPAERALRDAARLIAMVHELHKAGYQRIRICPSMAPNGIHWRCTISYAGNVAEDGCGFGGSPDGQVARYTSGDGARYFGWPEGLTARQMAQRFLETFPAIAEKGAGLDWPYAGWLTDVLGYAEHGKFVAFWADYPIDPEELSRWTPPPPAEEGPDAR
jgi:hypothetical protein